MLHNVWQAVEHCLILGRKEIKFIITQMAYVQFSSNEPDSRQTREICFTGSQIGRMMGHTGLDCPKDCHIGCSMMDTSSSEAFHIDSRP